MIRKGAIVILIILLPTLLLGKEIKKKPRERVIKAVFAKSPIKIDGMLNEEVWQGKGYSDFVQSDPIDGGKPTEKTVVWVAYDKEALYVAARLFDSHPDLIVSRLGRRDDRVDSDWFEFAIDPYFDRRSGFLFAVNPAGSIADATLYNDSWRDYSWDGVWEWAARVDDKGWTVEIRIPYHQLRFPKKSSYIWGVDFSRTIRRKNEVDTFVWIPKKESGYVSHFAKLVGVEGISPGRYIQLLPYGVGEVELMPSEEGNPFLTGRAYRANMGLDLKMCLRTNLILDAAINPDFGQVEVDPAVINLTAYETYYEEKRPFFIEGSSIFQNFGRGGITRDININWPNPTFFYSRRIGRAPQGEVSSDGYVKFPEWTTILGAAKITGKIGGGWNIGIINAITSREYAEIDEDGKRFKEEVEPLTYYGIFRVQRELNQGRQGLGFIATTAIRDLRTDELRDILTKDAFAFGVDGWTFLDKKRNWALNGWVGGTRLNGSKEAILGVQESSLHYFQRPDASYLHLNEEATSLSGWGMRMALSRERGNLMFNAALGALSPGFDVSDLGFQGRGSDLINAHLIVGYASFIPGKVFRNWWIAAGNSRSYDFGGNKLEDLYLIEFNFRLLNYWSFDLLGVYQPECLDNTLTRGGPLALSPALKMMRLRADSDRRKPIVLSFNGEYLSDNAGGVNFNWEVSLRFKPRSNIEFSVGPRYNYRYNIAQWVTKVDDPLMTATYGARYIFAEIIQRTVSTSIRLNWTFTPKLSLQFYLQPFIAVGKYDHFKELARARSYDFNEFGKADGSTISYDGEEYTVDPDGAGPAEPFSFSDPDFNYKSLRGTAVLRWEYSPGSVFYFVWTQKRADYSHPGDFRFWRDFGDLFTAPGENVFLVKFTYRFAM